MTTGPLAGKRIVLGVCGGIAAYKAVEICRRLVGAGAFISPVLTRGATRFIAPLTFSALASEPARVSLFAEGDPDAGSMTPHVELGQRADLVVVAPATARLIGAYAGGISSDLLTATLLATRAPVVVCPAMHAEMWEHPAVQHNISVLKARGVRVLGPEEGPLAGGDIGKGRLVEADAVVAEVVGMLAGSSRPLSGRHVVVSAGGTREPLDPVRYVGNRSSGKQGNAIAAELLCRGASVTLVTSSELAPPDGARVMKVETASEMADAVLNAEPADAVVMAAAVADYRPASVAGAKMPKSLVPLNLELVPTMDVLAELGARRRPGQVLAGFAAETLELGETDARLSLLAARGRAKLESKGVDIIVANEVGLPGAGFGEDRSLAVIVSRESEARLGLVGKDVVAAALVDAIVTMLGQPGRTTTLARQVQ